MIPHILIQHFTSWYWLLSTFTYILLYPILFLLPRALISFFFKSYTTNSSLVSTKTVVDYLRWHLSLKYWHLYRDLLGTKDLTFKGISRKRISSTILDKGDDILDSYFKYLEPLKSEYTWQANNHFSYPKANPASHTLFFTFISNITSLLKCNSHVMQFTHLNCTYQWCLVYSELCNYHHNQF